MREQEVLTPAVVAVAKKWHSSESVAVSSGLVPFGRGSNGKAKNKIKIKMLPGGLGGIRGVLGNPASVFSMSTSAET